MILRSLLNGYRRSSYLPPPPTSPTRCGDVNTLQKSPIILRSLLKGYRQSGYLPPPRTSPARCGDVNTQMYTALERMHYSFQCSIYSVYMIMRISYEIASLTFFLTFFASLTEYHCIGMYQMSKTQSHMRYALPYIHYAAFSDSFYYTRANMCSATVRFLHVWAGTHH